MAWTAEQTKAYNAAYYAKNKARLLAQGARYYEEHKAQYRSTFAEYYAKNSNRIKNYQREYREGHKEKISARDAEYRVSHPEARMAAQRKRRASKRGAEICDLTRGQWDAIKAIFNHRCVYCGVSPKRLTQDHIVPLSKGGEHTLGNVVPSCRPCNSSKSVNHPPKPVQPALLV